MANQRSFTFPSVLPTWHLGHMAKAVRDMKLRMKDVDVVIETRDARLPLTSINPIFEQLFKDSPNKNNNSTSSSNMPVRLIVYNKKDLADQRLEKPLKDAFNNQGQQVFFTNSKIDNDVRQILSLSRERACPRIFSRYGRADSVSTGLTSHTFNQSTTQPLKTKTSTSSDPNKGIKIMFCGMPNVGKSSLLNALRRVGCHKGKAASEAPMPGHTRSVGGMVKISDGSKHTAGWPVYAFDTPGIMIPYLGQGKEAADRAFKMAITAVIKDSLFDPYDLAAYLFHTLLQVLSPIEAPLVISKALQLPENTISLIKAFDHSQPLPTEDLLLAVSDRIKAVKTGGIPNLEAAAQWMLKCFRDGRFGGRTLDNVGQETTSASKKPIVQLIESSSEIDQSLDFSIQNTHSSNDYTHIDAHICNYLASNLFSQKSKTALKMDAKKAKKDLQRAQQQSLRRK